MSPYAAGLRLPDHAVAAQLGANAVGEGFFHAEIPPSFHLGAPFYLGALQVREPAATVAISVLVRATFQIRKVSNSPTKVGLL